MTKVVRVGQIVLSMEQLIAHTKATNSESKDR